MTRGGYDVVVHRKLWKYVYEDQRPYFNITNSTTSIKRHYERILLEFERFLWNDFVNTNTYISENQICYKPSEKNRYKSFSICDILQSSPM